MTAIVCSGSSLTAIALSESSISFSSSESAGFIIEAVRKLTLDAYVVFSWTLSFLCFSRSFQKYWNSNVGGLWEFPLFYKEWDKFISLDFHEKVNNEAVANIEKNTCVFYTLLQYFMIKCLKKSYQLFTLPFFVS